EPSVRPYPSNFLNRNRIVAALSYGTLVVQASRRSGSLVTARYAVEFGKELFVLPGSHCDPRYEGSNELLKHGAFLTTGVQDVWDVLPALKRASPQTLNEAECRRRSDSQLQLLKRLSDEGAVHFDALRAAENANSLHEDLLALEL